MLAQRNYRNAHAGCFVNVKAEYGINYNLSKTELPDLGTQKETVLEINQTSQYFFTRYYNID